jgi:hypothetical protein
MNNILIAWLVVKIIILIFILCCFPALIKPAILNFTLKVVLIVIIMQPNLK